jgi:tetratricopeptide (TPR) repeat protein
MQLYLRADGRAQGLDARAQAQAAQLQAMARERGSLALGLYNTWGTLANVSGEPEKALQRWTHVVDTARQDDPQQQVQPYHLAMLAQAHIGVGAYPQAADLLQQVLQTAQRSGIDSDRFNSLCSLGRVAGLQGDDDRARALFIQALAVPDHGEPLRRNAAPFCTMGQVEAALGAGRLADAAALLQGAGMRGDLAAVPRPARTGWLALQAELAWRQGDAARAEQLARQWLADARALQADNPQSARVGMATWMLSLTLRSQGRASDADAQAADALAHLQATVRPGHRWRRWAEAGG